MNKILGVIGGNGVLATTRLCQLVEEKVTKNGAFRDGHHPEMIVWYATPAPSRSMYLEGRGPSFIPDYINVGRKMKECGCTSLCMCCNTAHFAIKEISEGVGLPFISIIDEVVKRVVSKGYRKVGIICTEGCLITDLYGKSFCKYGSTAQLVYPQDEMRKAMTQGICNVKNSIRFDKSNAEHPTLLFEKVSESLIAKGVDCLIGGCTDISAAFSPSEYKGVPYYDSLDVLADIIQKDFTPVR